MKPLIEPKQHMHKACGDTPKYTWEELEIINRWYYTQPPRKLIETQESREWDGLAQVRRY